MFYFQPWVFLVLFGVLVVADNSANGNEKTAESFIDMVLSNLTACANYNWPLNNEKLIHVDTPQNEKIHKMDEHRCIAPRGKVMGGSSTTNGKMYVRANRADYDAWEAMGNSGWSYKDVLPYFLKTQRSNILDGDPGFHNKEGLLNVNYSNPTIFTPIILNGLDELGSKLVDYNGKSQIGAFKIQSTIKGNKTSSAGRSFVDSF